MITDRKVTLTKATGRDDGAEKGWGTLNVLEKKVLRIEHIKIRAVREVDSRGGETRRLLLNRAQKLGC